MRRRTIRIPTVLKLVLFMAAASCNLPSGDAEQPVVEATTEANDPAAPAPDGNPTSLFGPGTFTLNLPEGWDVTGPVPVEVGSGNSYDLWVLGIDATVNQGPGASRVAIGDAGVWSPEDFVQSQCSTCPAHEYEEVTVGGKPALRTQIGGGDVPILVTWYFVEHNGKFIALAIHDPETLEPLNEVIASIQFN